MTARKKTKARSIDTKDKILRQGKPIKEKASNAKNVSAALEGLKEGQVRNPWIEFAEAHPTGTIVVGKVSNVRSMRALVDFGQGVEGHLHVDCVVPYHLQALQHHDLRKYLKVGDVVEAVVKKVEAKQPKLVLQIDSQEFAKFDKRIGSGHPTDEDMDFEIKGVIEAAQTLRDASKEVLQIGLSLAELETAKSREIAEQFLEIAQARLEDADAAVSGGASEAAALLGKKRAAGLTPEHQRKAAEARSKKLSAKRRSEIAKSGADKRWKKAKSNGDS